MTLGEAARTLRSKNAGPLTLTLDILFEDRARYERASCSSSLTPERIAEVYGVEPADVTVLRVPVALAIKIALPRPIVAGSPGDRDVYGAQQHRPLLALEL